MNQLVKGQDVIAVHLQKGRQPIRSYAAAVQTVMGMRANEVKKLLKALVDTTVEVSQEPVMVCKLAAAQLVQTEMKFRQGHGHESLTLLPFNIHDFKEAINMGKQYADEYARVLPSDEENEGSDSDAPKKKRGRKGDTFDKVRSFFVDNPDAIESPAKTVAEQLITDMGVKYNTALVYVYKCKKLHDQGQLL